MRCDTMLLTGVPQVLAQVAATGFVSYNATISSVLVVTTHSSCVTTQTTVLQVQNFMWRASSPRVFQSAMHVALHEFPARPCALQRHRGGNPASGGPADPADSICIASLNVRRMWHRDQSLHDGFHILLHLLEEKRVGIISKIFLQEITSLPVASGSTVCL